jgi:hypothetical protein
MKPTPELVLNQSFAKVAMEMGPALPAGYSQGSATLTGVLLLMVGQEFNRAAAIRLKENQDMRALFGEQAAKQSGALGAALKTAAAQGDPDISVSALDASNVALKKTLIELQTAAEKAGDLALEQRILAMLKGWADARLIFLPAM